MYEDLRRYDPKRANDILSDEERPLVVTLHNGRGGFLHPFLLPGDYPQRVFGMDSILRSGTPDEIYRRAGFDPASLREKLMTYLR